MSDSKPPSFQPRTTRRRPTPNDQLRQPKSGVQRPADNAPKVEPVRDNVAAKGTDSYRRSAGEKRVIHPRRASILGTQNENGTSVPKPAVGSPQNPIRRSEIVHKSPISSGQPASIPPRGASAPIGQGRPPSYAPNRGAPSANAASRTSSAQPRRTTAAASSIPRNSPTPGRPNTPGSGSGPTESRPQFKFPKLSLTKNKVLLSIVLVLVIMLAWPMGLLFWANSRLHTFDALSAMPDTGGQTWLVIGSDKRGDDKGDIPASSGDDIGQRSDSLMLVHWASNWQASAVSLPRDTLVDIPGKGKNKINAAYSLGGAKLTVATVEKLTKIKIDHVIEVGMGGVTRMVDAVGGVELCYDRAVNDPFSGMVWKPGCKTVNGDEALAFARMRKEDPRGDIGRAERQRQVISKVVSTASKPGTLINPLAQYRLADTATGALSVDQGTGLFAVGMLGLAFKSASGAELTGAPPISNPDFRSRHGSAVLLNPKTTPIFFKKMLQGTLTPTDFQQE